MAVLRSYDPLRTQVASPSYRMSNQDERIPTRRPQRRLPSNRPLATVRRKKEKLRGGWVQSANFASECARKLLIL